MLMLMLMMIVMAVAAAKTAVMMMMMVMLTVATAKGSLQLEAPMHYRGSSAALIVHLGRGHGTRLVIVPSLRVLRSLPLNDECMVR